jgi:hypothetical protein
MSFQFPHTRTTPLSITLMEHSLYTSEAHDSFFIFLFILIPCLASMQHMILVSDVYQWICYPIFCVFLGISKMEIILLEGIITRQRRA